MCMVALGITVEIKANLISSLECLPFHCYNKKSKIKNFYLTKKSYIDQNMSHLYVSPLKTLVGVEDTDTNGNTSCAPLCYSTTV